MLEVASGRRIEEHAQLPFGHCGLGCQRHGIFLPLATLDLNLLRSHDLCLAHRGGVYELDGYPRCVACRACPYRETVSLTLAVCHAEKSLVGQAGGLVAVIGWSEGDIMRIAPEGAVVPHLHTPEALPPHERIGELERAVLDHLGIEAAVSGIVDVLKEEAIHRGLYRSAGLVGAYDKLVGRKGTLHRSSRKQQ